KEALGSRVVLRLGDQPRFADPRFAGKQDNLPLAAFRSLKEQVEGSEFGGATNDDGANDREIEWTLHGFCLSPAFLSATLRFVPPFLAKRSSYPFSSFSFSFTCARLTCV